MSAMALDTRLTVRRPGFDLEVGVTLAPGETVAVMGPSGAGKTTLLHAIAGLVRPDEGHVRVGDRLVASTTPPLHVPTAQRGIALLDQNPRLFPHLSVVDNVAFGLRAAGMRAAAARAVAEHWLERVGLVGIGARWPRTLSGGQQQRVAVARALAVAPALVLLDEPLAGLDPRTGADVRAVIHEQLRASSASAILVTHDILDAAALASRLMFLEDGTLTQDGPIEEVLRAPATDFAAVAAGLNRVPGSTRSGVWHSEFGRLRLADERSAVTPDGPTAAVFRPAEVSLRALQAEADAAMTGWPARVVRLERHPAGGRVHTAEPDVAVDVDAADIARASWEPGDEVWVELRPAAVRFVPALRPDEVGSAPSELPE
jgi:molybdate transport system ATP-binding protein